ncbi:MAG: hypothetical protein ACR2KG_07705 [Nocardioidaceae bacterium]
MARVYPGKKGYEVSNVTGYPPAPAKVNDYGGVCTWPHNTNKNCVA